MGALEADPAEVEFDMVNDLLPDGTTFDPAPVFPNSTPYLKLSGNTGQNELWTIHTTSQIIYRFGDTLCKLGPTLEVPEAGGIIPIHSSGYVISLTMSWEELAGAEKHEAVIYLDSDVTERLWSGTSPANGITAAAGNGLTQLLDRTGRQALASEDLGD